MINQTISIITPAFNEEDSIEECVLEVRRTMTEMLPDYDYEHIVCDNASTDSTVEVLRRLAADDGRLKVVVNTRNVGPLLNAANGLHYVTGDLVVPLIPADIQDPPSVIPEMVRALKPGIDVVYGIRTNRREEWHLRFSRSAYYWLVTLMSGGQTSPRHAGEFMLARRHVIDAVVAAGTRQAYVRGMVAQTRPRSSVVRYEWGERKHGKSRNSYPDLFDQAITGLVTSARAPLRLALPLGFLFAAFGFFYAIYNFVAFAAGAAHASQGIATLIVGVFLFGGAQLFVLGIIGEYVLAIHRAVNPPPPVLERETINLEASRR